MTGDKINKVKKDLTNKNIENSSIHSFNAQSVIKNNK